MLTKCPVARISPAPDCPIWNVISSIDTFKADGLFNRTKIHSKKAAGEYFLNSNEDGWQWMEEPGTHLIDDDQWTKISFLLAISDREQEVCRLLFEGITREEIAKKMDIKVRTVRHYLERLHAKLRVRNRVALVLRIVQVRDALNEIPDSDFPDDLLQPGD